MLIQEFTDMTGFEPTPEEFQEIESEYYRFDGDKQAFCKAFVERGGEKQVYARRAEYIKELESQLMDQEKEHKERMAKLLSENARLQEALVNRYRLTGKDKFLSILEKTSLVSISTIDSFSMNLLKKYGMNMGYSQDVTVRSYKQELRDIIIDIIDRNYRKGSSVKSVVGTGLYDAQRLFEDFYERLLSMGISVDDVDRMDWGEGTDPDSGNLQMFLRAVLDGIDGELEWRKRHNDMTSLSELTFDVSRALSLDEGLERRIKYLFVDEFQDTNTLQIDVLTSFIIQTDADLFVVGDSKQSIYRFRGADDSAFDVLDMHMKKAGRDIAVFELVNNYRTDPRVLDATVRVFRTWVSNGLLDDFNKPVGCGVSDGGVFRFKEMGAPDVKHRGRTGALLVTVEVAVPTKLSTAEREAFERLRDADTRDYRSEVNRYRAKM